MTPEALRRATAEHEAAHAAAAVLLGLPVEGIEVAGLDAHDPDDNRYRIVGLTSTAPVDLGSDDELRRRLAATLAPMLLEDNAPDWPIPDDAPPGSDTAHVATIVKALGLDHGDFVSVRADTYDLMASSEFRHLHAALAHLADGVGTLDASAVRAAQRITQTTERTPGMEHMSLKAATTVATDRGEFEAVISTQAADREKDIVSAHAMVTALRKWNRPVVFAWNHSTAADHIIGHIDPQSVREVRGEVVAAGRVDLDSTVGREAWRSFKSRSIGFSFGYLVVSATKREGGGRLITALDVFEVSATPTPMNNATRVLAAKSLDAERDNLEHDDDIDRVRQEGADLIVEAFAYADAATAHHDAELRAKSAALIREHAPVRVATFDA